MNDLRKAAEMALEALEDIFGKEKKDVGAINALRQALTPEVTPEVPCKTDPRIQACLDLAQATQLLSG
jgi:hypothetical protein